MLWPGNLCGASTPLAGREGEQMSDFDVRVERVARALDRNMWRIEAKIRAREKNGHDGNSDGWEAILEAHVDEWWRSRKQLAVAVIHAYHGLDAERAETPTDPALEPAGRPPISGDRRRLGR